VAVWPRTVAVDVAPASRGPLVVTVDEEGVTRVRERFMVSTPVAGRVLRVVLEVGDAVTRGQVVARIRPEAAPLLDARSHAEAAAAVASATAALGRARAEEQRAKATLLKAERDLRRTRELAANELVPPHELDASEAELQVAQENAKAAGFAVASALSELHRAEARLAPSAPDVPSRIVNVTAPCDGVVLKRLRESEAVVPAGDPLVEVGDPSSLELVTDLLSTDAVRIAVGARAMVDQWGGDAPLAARVRRIEPAGFMKISALGVEEQRVNVILDFVDPSAVTRARLGDGYRIEARVVVWESADVIAVPTSALFRSGDRWAVYTIDRGRARRTVVDVGHRTNQYAEVIAGLADGAAVILHPGDTLTDGSRVRVRAQASGG
jgi:HlyD family secretion protein